jgi:restriction system protein
MDVPSVSDVKQWSKNGRESASLVIDGRPFTCRVTVRRGKTRIDFDLFPGNHDLGAEASERLMQQYQDYCTALGVRSRIHSHFSKTSIMFEVREEHGEIWFERIWNCIQNPDNLERIRCELLSDYAKKKLGRILTATILCPHLKVKEGTLVRVAAPAWASLIELLQIDYEVLSTVSARQLEEIVAAAYDRVGFDRVVLTPPSGDHGRDIIAEKDGWGTIRVVVQVKSYTAKNLVSADEVRSLIGTYFMEPGATKAVLATTSDFAPRLRDAPNIAPLLGRELLLLNRKQLVERLVQTEYSRRGLSLFY